MPQVPWLGYSANVNDLIWNNECVNCDREHSLVLIPPENNACLQTLSHKMITASRTERSGNCAEDCKHE